MNCDNIVLPKNFKCGPCYPLGLIYCKYLIRSCVLFLTKAQHIHIIYEEPETNNITLCNVSLVCMMCAEKTHTGNEYAKPISWEFGDQENQIFAFRANILWSIKHDVGDPDYRGQSVCSANRT